MIADYYSRYPEVIRLTSTTSGGVITAMKSVFSRHGIPQMVVRGNGPQYDSNEMKEFVSLYGFNHVTTSPYFPQSNGFAQRMVKTVKKLLNGTLDMFIALLSYRSTPLSWCKLSPAKLLMGRRLKTDIPQTKELLVPIWPHLNDFAEKDRQYKERQKKDFDRRHRTRTLPPLLIDSDMWVNTQRNQVSGHVASPAATPIGRVRRNRANIIPQPTTTSSNSEPSSDDARMTTRSRSGVLMRPPDRLTYY